MTTAVWIAFGIFCVIVAAAIVFAAVHGLRLWREVRKLPKGLLGQLTEITQRAAEAQERTTALEKQVADLQQQVESLNASLSRARVLMGAAGEVRALVDSARSFIPSK
jgi:multidrug efflux pump subunit AcrA (membrane-fusion protein)